ncbi:hypothetical protein Alches_04450 [Alicyclobacillus hesperidum subsp. aegles]|uniref:hypothetical protein n=1 Tax=Alicyclobacillus hesperidum TaxID=89784 RepID=UPI0007192018|nr:hypothetical protein [Alicyclobacillus hesperidum]KRW92998.1 hypothetical protein SD51_01705 [Alicyclobacillus tengchongensis]GLG00406.1 hypothetical protein Alches_04450 [Alicyclobacillus hesperidum subsp. aegles]
MRDEERNAMLRKACEMLYHDVRLPLYERSHVWPEHFAQGLEQAADREIALRKWLVELLRVEVVEPIVLAGVRNALFHAFDAFKSHLSAAQRHDWLELILRDPAKARSRMHLLLLTYPDAMLASSYYWRADRWRISWFWHENAWWQFRVRDVGVNDAAVTWEMRPRAEVLAEMRQVGSGYDVEWMHAERLAVRFDNGEYIAYRWLAESH